MKNQEIGSKILHSAVETCATGFVIMEEYFGDNPLQGRAQGDILGLCKGVMDGAIRSVRTLCFEKEDVPEGYVFRDVFGPFNSVIMVHDLMDALYKYVQYTNMTITSYGFVGLDYFSEVEYQVTRDFAIKDEVLEEFLEICNWTKVLTARVYNNIDSKDGYSEIKGDVDAIREELRDLPNKILNMKSIDVKGDLKDKNRFKSLLYFVTDFTEEVLPLIYDSVDTRVLVFVDYFAAKFIDDFNYALADFAKPSDIAIAEAEDREHRAVERLYSPQCTWNDDYDEFDNDGIFDFEEFYGVDKFTSSDDEIYANTFIMARSEANI